MTDAMAAGSVNDFRREILVEEQGAGFIQHPDAQDCADQGKD
ncbi:hypothetical protein ACQKKX_07720 [Neorhizobium sp. NPDC001467]